MTVNDISTYCIEIRGWVEQDDIKAMSPIELRVERADKDATRLTVTTDQSGLIGLMRHLHARGLVLLSITCDPDKSGE